MHQKLFWGIIELLKIDLEFQVNKVSYLTCAPKLPLQSHKNTRFPRAIHSTEITHKRSKYVESAALFCYYLVFFNIKLKVKIKEATPHKIDLIQAAQHLCIHHSLGYLLLEHISLHNIKKPQG